MTDRPNILMIWTDQHRLSALGAYGPTPCQTPHMDRLAAEGVLFENAYCPLPMCSPARASFFTGQYPHRHGMTSNIGTPACAQQHIADTHQLLSRRLLSAGYRCGYSGKWHLCAERNKRTRFQDDYILNVPTDFGFDGQDFPGHGGGGFEYPEYREYLAEHGFTHEVEPYDPGYGYRWDCGELKGLIESTVPYFLTSHTLDLIDRYQAEEEPSPWFVWHNFWGPHEPYYVTEAHLAMYRDVEIPEWPNFHWPAREIDGPHVANIPGPPMPWSHWAELIRHYYAFATMIDDQIGRMVSHLEEHGLMEDTIIVLTADHGESLGSHGGVADKGPLYWDDVLKVPLIARGPGIAGGQSCDQVVSNMDLHPTVCAWAGAICEADTIDGVDISELCAHPVDTPPVRDAFVAEWNGADLGLTQRTLRWGRFKYGWTFGFPEVLYDLETDPHEVQNLAADPANRETLIRCRSKLEEWMVQHRDQAQGFYRRRVIGS